MRRLLAFVVLALCATLAIARTRSVGRSSSSEAVATQFGAAVVDLTAEQRARFDAGAAEFVRLRKAADGLGPVSTGPHCRQCHNEGGPAGNNVPGGGSGSIVLRIGRITNGAFDPMTEFGGSIVQPHGLSGPDAPHPFPGEEIPRGATIRALRRSQPLFGLGLVDATPDETFIALARMQAATDPSTAGRVSFVTNVAMGTKTVGKFGWKANVPSLLQFAGDALVNELGITNPFFPDEHCPSGNCAELAFNPMPALNDDGTAVRALTDFMLMLGPPPRGPITPAVREGERVFAEIGCATCHLPTLVSGPSDISALNRKTYHPYSGFLLHDMGPTGSDGIEQETAKGNEFRTAPLWGLRAIKEFMHHGRAFTIEKAIEFHDGQARPARDRFLDMDEDDRANLLAFLRSL